MTIRVLIRNVEPDEIDDLLCYIDDMGFDTELEDEYED